MEALKQYHLDHFNYVCMYVCLFLTLLIVNLSCQSWRIANVAGSTRQKGELAVYVCMYVQYVCICMHLYVYMYVCYVHN